LVTKAGVKLLDFGLAKMGPAVKADEATMTMALTGKGKILGTLLYMSPEQVNGRKSTRKVSSPTGHFRRPELTSIGSIWSSI